MTGSIGVLNVGAGDTKLTFDKDNPMERARSARIVTDMLKRGYVLFIEVPGSTVKTYRRVLQFDEEVCEYIIADLDPQPAPAPIHSSDTGDNLDEPSGAAASGEGNEEARAPIPLKGRRGRKRVDAGSTTGVAVARSAGG